MRVFDVLAWVVVALATVKTIYYVVMLATGPARARRAARRGAHVRVAHVRVAHVRVALTGTGAPREAWQEASGAVIAVAAGILLNLRYLAISMGAAPGLRGGWLSRVLRVQMANDASYALGATVGTPEVPDERTIVIAGAAMYVAWVSGTAIGALLGPVLGDPRTIGADVALPAGFAVLLVPMLRERGARRAALAGTVIALALSPFVPLGVAVAAATAGGALVQWSR